jgi:hypothetical protein
MIMQQLLHIKLNHKEDRPKFSIEEINSTVASFSQIPGGLPWGRIQQGLAHMNLRGVTIIAAHLSRTMPKLRERGRDGEERRREK